LAAGAVTLLVVASACGSSSPSAPTEPCSYTLSATHSTFTADAGRGTVGVATRQDCAWSVAGTGEWVGLLTPTSAFTGSGTADFSVTANTGAAREKTLTVAGHAFSVRQDGAAACTYAIDPERGEFAASGGTGSVTVSTRDGCAWTAEPGAAWIAVDGERDRRGAGSVSYAVAENNATTPRTGTIAIAGRTHTVEQRSEASPLCEYRVSPVQFDPCMPGGTGSAKVTAGDGCRWTATASASWLTISSGRSGTGSGTIAFAWTDNYLAPRAGIVMVRWPTASLGQNVHVDQAGCTYAVSRAAIDVPSAGGAVSVDVLQMAEPNTCGGPLQDRCVWRARSDVSWITVTTPMPRSGDNPVSLTVAPNTGAARIGHVTVADETVTITQASGT
jgi:hypothetical protein